MLDGKSNRDPDLSSPPLGWWAVYTRHQHEKVVADMLVAKGFEVFLPLYETMHHWKDRNKRLRLPLFPCYLFVRENMGGRLQIMTTPGTHTILTRGESLAIISDQEMQAIWLAAGDPARVEPYPYLRCGERVRVRRGTLQGVEGILIRKKNLFRLVLTVDMLAQSVAVEVDAADVEPTSPAKPLPARVPAATTGRQVVYGNLSGQRS